MKLTQSLALLVGAAFTIPFALANYHILHVTDDVGSGNKFIACPSNQYGCNCFENGVSSVEVVVNPLESNFIYINSGLCGMGQLDLYLRSYNNWDIYQHGGDGTLQGRCSSTETSTKCGNSKVQYRDVMICETYICGN